MTRAKYTVDVITLGVPHTKPSARPYLDQNLCEHSGSGILGRLQNKLEGKYAMGKKAYFPGSDGPSVMVTMVTHPFQLFLMSVKLLKIIKPSLSQVIDQAEVIEACLQAFSK